MEKLQGTLKKRYIDSVREDLRHYARWMDENARNIERYSVGLALEIEELNKPSLRSDLDLQEMNTRYVPLKDDFGNTLLKKADILDPGMFLSLAVGCPRVPVTPEVMQKLRAYESIKPSMLRMYDEVENIDGIFLFDIESNIALMRTEYNFENSFDLPGVDLTALYDFGVISYNWFECSDRKNNPERKALWSATAFIAIEHDWIMHLKAPIYTGRYTEQEKLIGIVGVHLNLDWVTTCTIGKHAIGMMIVKDDSTLIGLNGPAKNDIGLETFEKSAFTSMNGFDPATTLAKKRFVQETLNLEHDKEEDVVSFAGRLKSEFRFRHTLRGKTYTVLRERAPELGLNFIALIDDGD